MLNISEIHRAPIIVDTAALFIVIGIIVYTSIYRRRGRTQDKLYFILNIICAIMAVSDAMFYVFDGSTFKNATLFNQLSNDIFYFFFEWFFGLLAVYMAYRYRYDKAHKGGRLSLPAAVLISIPAVISSIMIIVNHFHPFLYGVDATTNEYYSAPYYVAMYIAPIIYILITMIYILLIDKSVAWLFVLLLVVRLLLGYYMPEVFSTAIMIAIGLAYIHIHVMKTPFFELSSYDDEVTGGSK